MPKEMSGSSSYMQLCVFNIMIVLISMIALVAGLQSAGENSHTEIIHQAESRRWISSCVHIWIDSTAGEWLNYIQ